MESESARLDIRPFGDIQKHQLSSSDPIEAEALAGGGEFIGGVGMILVTCTIIRMNLEHNAEVFLLRWCHIQRALLVRSKLY